MSTSDGINKVLGEIKAIEQKKGEVLDFMNKVGMKTYARPTTTNNQLTDTWDEYHELGEVLNSLQLRLATLLQESTKDALDRLNLGITKLNATIAVLVKSSQTLETLTLFLIALAALTAGYGFLGPNNSYSSYYSVLFLVLLMALTVWTLFTRRGPSKLQTE